MNTSILCDTAPASLRRPFRAELEVNGFLAGFLQMGRVSAFARWAGERQLWWLREPGSVEVALGRWRLTMSREG